MNDPRHKAAVIRAHEVLRTSGVRISPNVVDLVVSAVLADGTDHDPTRYGRHLAGATSPRTDQTKEDR